KQGPPKDRNRNDDRGVRGGAQRRAVAPDRQGDRESRRHQHQAEGERDGGHRALFGGRERDGGGEPHGQRDQSEPEEAGDRDVRLGAQRQSLPGESVSRRQRDGGEQRQ